MPYSRKRSKRPRRKRQSRRQTMTIRKSPMPLKFATKLRYVENYTLDGAAAGLANVSVFNAGGLYDPSVTLAGHQPRGFDQLIAMYDHFIVIGSKITVTFTASSTESYNQICGVSLRDGSSTDSDPNDYLEGGSNVYNTLSPDSPTKTMSLGYSPKRFLGISKPLATAQLKGSVSGDPSESAYFHTYVAGLNATNPTTVTATARIDYLVVFVEPKDVAQS